MEDFLTEKPQDKISIKDPFSSIIEKNLFSLQTKKEPEKVADDDGFGDFGDFEEA